MQIKIQKQVIINICQNILQKMSDIREQERPRIINILMNLHEQKIIVGLNFFLLPTRRKLTHPISKECAEKITHGILPEEFNNKNDRIILLSYDKREIDYDYFVDKNDFGRRWIWKVEDILKKLNSSNICDEVLLDLDDRIYKIAEEWKEKI
jgi:hypothetical protein